MGTLIPARKWTTRTTVRGVAPLAAALAMKLARLTGSDVNGSRGAVRIGEVSAIGRHYAGYAQSPQSFKGAASVPLAGAIVAGADSGLPGTQAPWSESSPLLAAIATAQNGQR